MEEVIDLAALITPVPSASNGWLVVISLLVYAAFYAIGPGVCVWLALSELMPTRIRSNGMSIALLINQAVSTTIAAIFLPTVGKYGYSTMFFVFAGSAVIYLLTAIFVLPEVESIEQRLMQSMWHVDGNRADLFLTPEVEVDSIGAGLGLVPGQYVAQAVAESREASERERAWIDGRHGRANLSADGLLSEPSLWAPRASDLAPAAEKPAQTARGFRQQLREAAQRRGSAN